MCLCINHCSLKREVSLTNLKIEPLYHCRRLFNNISIEQNSIGRFTLRVYSLPRHGLMDRSIVESLDLDIPSDITIRWFSMFAYFGCHVLPDWRIWFYTMFGVHKDFVLVRLAGLQCEGKTSRKRKPLESFFLQLYSLSVKVGFHICTPSSHKVLKSLLKLSS